MENSSRFFANKECEYYPCHKMSGDINCLFCYCPLYNTECPGNYKMVKKGENEIKSCIDCVFPHNPDNYDKVISLLKRSKANKKM
ncbi:Cysteine-rich small domain-containing protein [Lachnospiraceae bacterium NE2001]|nr:Cysteine-rich small domain-containing protein [Lachnospiraceae bacterium NE2001]